MCFFDEADLEAAIWAFSIEFPGGVLPKPDSD
jgi:hypothetical protein